MHSSNLSNTQVIESAVTEAKTIIVGLSRVTLMSYWQLGKLVSELDTGYGTSAVKTFAKRLSADADKEFSEASLYRMRQFFDRTPENKLEGMITSGIKWGQIVNTLSADQAVVNELIDQVIDSNLPPEKFVDAVKVAVDGDGIPPGDTDVKPIEIEPESAEDKLGDPREMQKQLVVAYNNIVAATNSMGDVLILMDKFKNLDKDAKKPLVKHVRDIRTALSDLSSCGGATVESVDAALA